MTPLDASDKASAALHEPVIKKAFADIRESIVAHMEQVAIGDRASKEDFIGQLQALKAVQLMLMKYLGYGAVEKNRIKQDRFIEENRETYKTRLPRARQQTR